MKGSVDSIETFGLVDGPGIRTVVFLNGCDLRCKFCHNPEMWNKRDDNYTPEEVVKKIVRNKPYFKRNNGGATFSGGEPLQQYDFLVECCKLLKKEEIHVAIDTAGIGFGDYSELLSNIDMVLLDIKHITRNGYKDITNKDYLDKFFEFVDQLNKYDVDVWIRQVIVPGVHDNTEYIRDLSLFLKRYIKNVKRVDFLPYHKLGSEKYEKLNLYNPYKEKEEMDVNKCNMLYNEFRREYEEI